MFVKLYGTDEDQVLVVKAADGQGRPIINFSTEALTYVDSVEKGVVLYQERFNTAAQRDEAFDLVDEEAARLAAGFATKALSEQLAEERRQLGFRLDLS